MNEVALDGAVATLAVLGSPRTRYSILKEVTAPLPLGALTGCAHAINTDLPNDFDTDSLVGVAGKSMNQKQK